MNNNNIVCLVEVRLGQCSRESKIILVKTNLKYVCSGGPLAEIETRCGTFMNSFIQTTDGILSLYIITLSRFDISFFTAPDCHPFAI